MPWPRRTKAVPVELTPQMLPEYDRGAAPEHLLTRLQLRARNLSPGGQPIAGVLRCKACVFRPGLSCIHPTRAWLLDVRLARPKRTSTLAQEWALDRANAARSTCPTCCRRYEFCIPLKRLGTCLEGHDGTPADPTTYIAPPASHHLAA